MPTSPLGFVCENAPVTATIEAPTQFPVSAWQKIESTTSTVNAFLMAKIIALFLKVIRKCLTYFKQ